MHKKIFKGEMFQAFWTKQTTPKKRSSEAGHGSSGSGRIQKQKSLNIFYAIFVMQLVYTSGITALVNTLTYCYNTTECLYVLRYIFNVTWGESMGLLAASMIKNLVPTVKIMLKNEREIKSYTNLKLTNLINISGQKLKTDIIINK